MVAERTRADFHLFSHAKRAEALDLIDDHMSRTEPSNIRDADKLVKQLRALFVWAIKSGHATFNPAAGVEKIHELTGCIPGRRPR